MIVEITESAASRIKEMLADEEDQNQFLRVAVKGGGCTGLSYGMGFDSDKSDSDQEEIIEGIRVVVDEESAKVLKGTVVDFKQNMMGGGFTITNPNAIASCGCGSSFRTATNAGTPEEC
ncbi:MAG: HesB/IscA family protein [Bacillota bacterium]|uniref:Iron-sulfur cluster assembly accessory protein n=1 Tax=Fictibacillus nanhaiensis TaxID=742169 RepID=A0ABS2ZWZ3_9BACL|nr:MULTISPECIES: iron-sulfur cluster assembly accessory protein [Fictibacillus]MBH0171115.1 iron-sulfur cluster assembly accessory protein [Fictibacillus sp. 18YEL24]MBN3556604.1 iron-sulfur cluster assembly accessory protein [Fictibacillus nanhaiensis]